MSFTVQRLRRVEVWSDAQCAGGTRLAVVPRVTACTASGGVDGDERLTLAVPLDSPVVSLLRKRRVVRLVEDSAAGLAGTAFDEWRLLSDAAATDDGTLTVTAGSIALDLGTGTLIRETDADGAVAYDFERIGLAPSDHLSGIILPAATAAGMSWVTAGTVTPTTPVDLTYAWDSPLSALRKLAEACGCELDVRRDGTTGYVVDLVTAVGASAPTLDLRAGRNLREFTLERSRVEQVTRVYPRGTAEDGLRPTMAGARWRVAALSGAGPVVVTLEDPAGGDGPLAFDTQLVGLWLERADGSRAQITASDASDPAAQTVTIGALGTLAEGDLVAVRATSTGARLTWLDHPTEILASASGLKSGVLDVEAPGTVNLLRNPAMRSWADTPGALPDDWSAVGSPTLTKTTTGIFTRVGGASLRVEAASDGEGVTTTSVPLPVTGLRPFLSGFGLVWVISGQVRVELVLTTPSGTVVYPPAPAVASSTYLGQWLNLGAAGLDAFAEDATAVALRVVQHGSAAATFHVDGGQATISAAQEPYVEGSGPVRLWQAANRWLQQYGTPVESYRATLADLHRLDPERWGAGLALTPGQTVRVVEPRVTALALGGGVAPLLVRLTRLERNYLEDGSTTVELGARRTTLTGTAGVFGASAGGTSSGSPTTGGRADAGSGDGAAIGAEVTVFAAYGERVVLVAQGAAEAVLGADPGAHQDSFDVTPYTEARIVAQVLAAGAAGSRVGVQCSLDDGGTWRDLGDDGAVEASLAAVGTVRGAWMTLGADVIGDVLLRPVVTGGDGTASPALGNLKLQLRVGGARPVTIPSGGDPDGGGTGGDPGADPTDPGDGGGGGDPGDGGDPDVCNSDLASGRVWGEDFCALADLDALLTAYGYSEDPPGSGTWTEDPGYAEVNGGQDAVYVGYINDWTGQNSVVHGVAAHGSHAALRLDVPAALYSGAPQYFLSDWQYERPTGVDFVTRMRARVRLSVDAVTDLSDAGSLIELVSIAFLGSDGATATAGFGVITDASLGGPRLYFQTQSTPTGGPGPYVDLGAASQLVGAGVLEALLDGEFDETTGEITWRCYLHAWDDATHAPIHTATQSLPTCQTVSNLHLAKVTAATAGGSGPVPRVKLDLYELEVMPGYPVAGLD